MSERTEPASLLIPEVSKDASCVVLFGGSFDPVTLAHTTMAARARDLAEADGWLVFAPASRSPLKDDGPEASDAERIEMLRLATREIPRCAIWTDDIDRARDDAGSASYTIDTLERARAALGAGTRLRLLIGADQALSFHRWRAFRRILEIAPAIVMPRGPIRDGATLARSLRGVCVWSRRERADWSRWLTPIPEMDVSATRVRELLDELDSAGLESLVDPAVIEFIRERRLYAER